MQMRAGQYCTAVLSVVASVVLTTPTRSVAQRPIAFTHVSVIDGTASEPRPDQTVVIRGTRITAVGPSRSTAAPAGARVVEEPDWLWPREPPIRHRRDIPTAWLEMTLTEGRNRQVRRMTAAAGYPTLRLVRARIGDWALDGLRPGEWKVI